MSLPASYLFFNQQGKTVLSHLAYKHHAVSEAYPNPLYAEIIFGFALAGDERKLAALCKTPEDWQHAVRGLARAGFTSAADKYRIEHKLTPDYLIQGLAEANNKEIKEALSYWQHQRDNYKYLKPMIKGWALGGHQESLLTILPRTSFQAIAIEYAACGNHQDLVKKLLLKQNIDLETLNASSLEEKSLITKTSVLALLNQAVIGYAKGRHFSPLAKLIEIGANPAHAFNTLRDDGDLTKDTAILLLAHIENNEKRDEVRKSLAAYSSIDLTKEQIDTYHQTLKEEGNGSLKLVIADESKLPEDSFESLCSWYEAKMEAFASHSP